ALTHRPQNYKGLREEYAGLEESFRQGGLVKTLGKVPLLAISAADAPKVPGVSAEWLRNFIVEVGKLHDDLATLSTRGRRIVLPGNHGSMVTEKANAELVARQILGVVHEAAEYRALR
ncbi:MAG: hypothetical protein JWM77_1643, partial [Rhodospirillales bacterium]|nr:hypothetical protein [Rhodospirillales bacterium]